MLDRRGRAGRFPGTRKLESERKEKKRSTRAREVGIVLGIVALQHGEDVVVFVHGRLVRARLVRVVPHAAFERRFAEVKVGLFGVQRRAESLFLFGLGLVLMKRGRTRYDGCEAARLRSERQREGEVEERGRRFEVGRADIGSGAPIGWAASTSGRATGAGKNCKTHSLAPARALTNFPNGIFATLRPWHHSMASLKCCSTHCASSTASLVACSVAGVHIPAQHPIKPLERASRRARCRSQRAAWRVCHVSWTSLTPCSVRMGPLSPSSKTAMTPAGVNGGESHLGTIGDRNCLTRSILEHTTVPIVQIKTSMLRESCKLCY